MLIPGPNKRDHRVIWIIQDNGVLRTSLRDSAQCSVTFKQHPEVFQEPLQQLHLLYGRGTWQILAKGASYRPYGNNHETKTLHGSILSNRRMQMCSLWSSRTSIDNDPCVDDLPPNAWLLLFSMATSMSASMSARKLPQRMVFFSDVFRTHSKHPRASYKCLIHRAPTVVSFWQADVSLSERVIDFFNVLSSPIHQGILYQLVVSTRWKMMEWVKVSWDDYSIPFRIPFSEWIWMESQSKFHGSSHHQPAISLTEKVRPLGVRKTISPKPSGWHFCLVPSW